MTDAPCTWLPHDLHDEVIPPLRRSPNAWLLPPDAEGKWKLDGWDHGWGVKSLSPGDLVTFSWHQKRGTSEVRVSDDRVAEAIDGKVGGNCFTIDGDVDTLMDDFDTCVETHIDNLSSHDLPTSFTVDGYFWSDEILFRLEVSAHLAVLVPCDPAGSRLPEPMPSHRLLQDAWLLGENREPMCRLNETLRFGQVIDEQAFSDWRSTPLRNGEPVPEWLRRVLSIAAVETRPQVAA